MDHRAGLSGQTGTTVRVRPEPVQAEQAIFTSIRTPMGEGYRLIAMSPGITSEERAEITRRSPSHGSLCDDDPAANALASYLLASQRHCVAWTRYAGREYSSRGGQRVHTHLVVLEPVAFQAFACDPFRVHAAMREILGDTPNLKPNTCLQRLSLAVPHDEDGHWQAFRLEHVEPACRTAAALLAHESLLVIGTDSTMNLLRGMFALLPHAWRADLSASANLQYAQSRQIRLTCVGQNSPELQRALQGHDVHVLDLAMASTLDRSPYADWFRLILDRADQGRFNEIVTLADQMDGTLDASTLARIVSVSRDGEGVELASQDALEDLVTRYGDLHPNHPVEGRLVRQLLSAAVHRCGILQHAVAG